MGWGGPGTPSPTQGPKAALSGCAPPASPSTWLTLWTWSSTRALQPLSSSSQGLAGNIEGRSAVFCPQQPKMGLPALTACTVLCPHRLGLSSISTCIWAAQTIACSFPPSSLTGDPIRAPVGGRVQEGEHQHNSDGPGLPQGLQVLLLPQDDHPHHC